MVISGINATNLESLTGTQKTSGQNTTQLINHILEFADIGTAGLGENEPSDAKIKTETFIDSIMRKLDTSKSELSLQNIKYNLRLLVENIQILNGIHKNNLKPNGNAKQNEHYYQRIHEMSDEIKNYLEDIGCGLNVVKNSTTGLYKLCINGQYFNIPDRKVEINTFIQPNAEDDLIPEIVD